ncbi:unnamed protein product [Bursaphelenchus okinawaensis]|uniref:Uncharacterized protein n=1 Tax=Bursaphelenchus okinawaensis TaxID=465554 RepID=A0A811LQT1_9BILA|nr:unnamed protein product [Bursaphelenchus okinawaensis]CAG9126817.1 unnamed protein product [Bursaphelenchus okinawaensis]
MDEVETRENKILEKSAGRTREWRCANTYDYCFPHKERRAKQSSGGQPRGERAGVVSGAVLFFENVKRTRIALESGGIAATWPRTKNRRAGGSGGRRYGDSCVRRPFGWGGGFRLERGSTGQRVETAERRRPAEDRSLAPNGPHCHRFERRSTPRSYHTEHLVSGTAITSKGQSLQGWARH